jgi:hypothetical protein
MCYILGQRTKQDKSSMPSNDYPVAGQAALNLVMNALNDNRLPDTDMDMGKVIVL